MKALMPIAAALTTVLFGCTAGPDTADNADRDAAIYGAVIGDVAERSGLADGMDPDDLPLVFVEAFETTEIPLEVQVAVIAALAGLMEIRFVDLREEAIDVDLPSFPVRPESILIGLGPIEVEATGSVRAELYLSSDRVTAFMYELRGSGERWMILDSSPRQVAPEGFLTPP